MTKFVLLCCCLGSALAGKPPHDNVAEVARWQMEQANWGILATTSQHLNGIAFGNPNSVMDALGDGTPYFYVSDMDASMIDIAANPSCTLTLSEASIDCHTLSLDPEDPRCIRLSLSGKMVDVTDEDETAKAKAALFERHPVMKSWPAGHNFKVTKLQIHDLWLIDFFGGAANIPLTNYSAAKRTSELVVVNASHTPSKSKPLFWKKAATARWLAHEAQWGALATTSIHLNGTAFGNTISMSDGTDDTSSGIPYFFVSDLDTSMQDLKRFPNFTLTLTEASADCTQKHLDPEDPRCVRLAMTGTMLDVTEAGEVKFAKAGLYASHPQMATWPASHDFHVTKMHIEKIWLIDMFGGASDISPMDYFAVKEDKPYQILVV